MKADGPRWELTQERAAACRCGTRPGILRNCRSGSRVIAQHLTPKGKRCREPIGSVVRLEAAPAAAARAFPGEKYSIGTVVISAVYSLESADRIERNIEVTGQPFNRAPVQLELFPR